MDHSKDPVVQHYSGLEVVSHLQPEADQVTSGLEVVSHLQPEADQVAYPEIVPEPEVVRSCWRRKWVWVTVFGVLVIGAIVGGVGGVVLQRHPDVLPTQTGSRTATTSTTTVATTSVLSTPVMSGAATALSSYAYPTALSWGYPHLEVYALSSTSNDVYWKYRGLTSQDTVWNPTDGSLSQVGGPVASFETAVAVIARGGQNVDIFIAGHLDNMLHLYHQNSTSWSPPGWDLRGGILTTAPTVISWNEGRLDLFVMGSPSGLCQMTWDSSGSGWSNWFCLGGTWAPFTPTAVTWAVGRLDIFLVHPVTKALYHVYFDGSSWQPNGSFESLGGYCTERPTVVSRSTGHLDVFVRGGDAGLWHLSYSQTWSNWTSIGGNTSIQAEVEALSWDPNRIDIFAWGADQSLLHKSYDATLDVWTPSTGFEVLGGVLSGPPKAVSDAHGSMHVFSYSRYNVLQHISWNQTVGTWTSIENLGTPP